MHFPLLKLIISEVLQASMSCPLNLQCIFLTSVVYSRSVFCLQNLSLPSTHLLSNRKRKKKCLPLLSFSLIRLHTLATS